jgi:serine/threonine-protein kinase
VAKLIFESGPLRGKAIDIPSQGSLEVGRDTACPIHIPDGRVSRQHCALVSDGGHYAIEDKASSNGTYVNGKRIARTTLRTGDLIRIGETFMSFSTEPADPLVGKTVAGYLIEARIGRGGMGTVYRAHQLALDRTVAFKVISPSVAEDADFVTRFLEEARSAGKLNHPNVVQVYNAGQEDGRFFLSMEYMAGGSLQERLDAGGPLEPEAAIVLILDAAKALIWAAENAIVHRDIKPDNLLLTADERVKVGDFGLAADRRKSKTLYAGGKILGTPGFMAPEQALGKQVDHRADVYALGSTLYAALAGAPPFEGEAPIEILLKKLKEPPRPLAKARPGTPPAVVSVVEKMMAREPDDRYQSAIEAHVALEEALEAAGRRGSNGGGIPGRLARALRRGMGRLAPGRKRTEG